MGCPTWESHKEEQNLSENGIQYRGIATARAASLEMTVLFNTK